MRHTLYIIFVVVAAILTCCTGKSGTKHVPQASDTLHTEEAAMDVYAEQPERALEILDSAEIVGDLTKDRADLMRAKVFSQSIEATRQDTTIVICEHLLKGQKTGISGIVVA